MQPVKDNNVRELIQVVQRFGQIFSDDNFRDSIRTLSPDRFLHFAVNETDRAKSDFRKEISHFLSNYRRPIHSQDLHFQVATVSVVFSL